MAGKRVLRMKVLLDCIASPHEYAYGVSETNSKESWGINLTC